jgi:hypothetical protein
MPRERSVANPIAIPHAPDCCVKKQTEQRNLCHDLGIRLSSWYNQGGSRTDLHSNHGSNAVPLPYLHPPFCSRVDKAGVLFFAIES